ncbi:MAG TPA: LPS export ABC transporter permease LptG [Caulobacterales bacterium]|jgi:lipopolysaccharide export system permease protein|nr:LPS export ABC transporter permease LptG [Caulobacterales bacterium]
MLGFLTSRLGRYLLAQALIGILLTLLGVAAAVLLVDVVEQLRTVGARVPLSLFGAVYLTMLKAPQLLQQTLPFVVLVGTMIALTRLNRRSELIAIRAAGVSAWRFVAPTAAVAALIGIVSTTVINPIASDLYGIYERETARLLGQREIQDAVKSGVWLRQGDKNQQIVIHADTVNTKTARLDGATLTFFDVTKDGALKFARLMHAKQADLRDGFWQLTAVTDAAPGEAVSKYAHLALPTPLKPTALLDKIVNPSTLSFWRLPSYINQAKAAGVAPVRYELAWHALIAAPAFLAAMAVLGAVFSLRLQRLGGVAQLAATGVAIGFLLFFADRMVSAFALAELTPPPLAAWAPPIAGLFGAMAVLSYMEEG